LTGANFRHANLRGANLSAIQFDKADLRGANLQGANLNNTVLAGSNLAGASLADTDLSSTNLDDVIFQSVVEVSFPFSMDYGDFLTFLSQQDCANGTFLVPSFPSIQAVPVLLSEDLGGDFYTERLPLWRNASKYVCATDLSNARIWNIRFGRSEMAGVNLSGADLSYSNLSQVNLTQDVDVEGARYELTANLEGVIDNSLTRWPPSGRPTHAPTPTPTPAP
jgi:uncharacterized protein YjbI with pentapeptide repeats